MGALMRAHDWSGTPFGPTRDWPQSLCSAVSICLGTKFPIAIYWGPELALLYNDAWSPIPGEKHPWALGRPGGEVWPEIWDTIGPLYEKVQATGEGVWQQDQLLPMRRHGYTEEAYFNFTFSPIRGESGHVDGIFNAVVETTFRVIEERRTRVLRDLAERTGRAKSADEACVLAAGALGEAAADVPFCLVYLLDGDMRRARLAAAAGLAPDGPASPRFIDLGPAAPWPLDRVLASGQVKTVDRLAERFGFALPGGPWPEPVDRAMIAPIAGSQPGEPAGFLVAGTSPRRAVDDEYRAFFERAAGQVATVVSNARAYEDERRRAEALAEIDRAKTAFFSNVSHEFRTPLTLMLGPLEESLADSERLIPEERERVRVVHRNGLRLLKLVNSLLDFARIEAGRTQATFEPTDLAALTAEVASNFRSATEKAGLKLRVDCQPLPEPVHVDRDMWEKVVLNLLSNAFKFTFEGEIAVELRPGDGGVTLTVRDTGTGISPHELPRLFERFHRIEGARGRSYEGSGIGLALVQELVNLHGGAIRVESEEGRGSTFIVSVPLGDAHLPRDRVGEERALTPTTVRAYAYVEEALRWLPDAPPTEQGVEKSLAPMPGLDKGERARVLLADDNADMRDYIARLLGERHAVEAVADGEAALEAIRARRPDLVLTDIMMPRLDGFGLLRAIRQDPELRDIPVLVLSARAGEEASIEGLSAGADDYLVKPFSARELNARVGAALALSRARRDASAALRELNETLEQRVAQAIADREAAEEQLRQSQKMEAMGSLTGGVAHDFNNLLTPIVGALDRLQRKGLGGEREQRLIAGAMQSAERARTLVQRLLAFARRQPLQPVPVDVAKLVAGMGDLVASTTGPQIRVVVEASPDLAAAHADPNQIEMALLNLSVNARDAMPEGGTLRISASAESVGAGHRSNLRPGPYIRLSVADTGQGMDEATLARAVEPFFSTKGVGKGTGLGLSMVHGLASQLGGALTIQSKAGLGTNVELWLSQSVADPPKAAEPAPEPLAAAATRGTALVVDDEELVRMSTADMLNDLGYDVIEAGSAEEALRLVQGGRRFDLLVTDHLMPGMSGTDLAMVLRTERPGMPVLLVSGYAESDGTEPGLSRLTKPFRKDELAASLAEISMPG